MAEDILIRPITQQIAVLKMKKRNNQVHHIIVLLGRDLKGSGVHCWGSRWMVKLGDVQPEVPRVAGVNRHASHEATWINLPNKVPHNSQKVGTTQQSIKYERVIKRDPSFHTMAHLPAMKC